MDLRALEPRYLRYLPRVTLMRAHWTARVVSFNHYCHLSQRTILGLVLQFRELHG